MFVTGAALLARSVARLLRGGPVPPWVDGLFGVLSVLLFGGLCVLGVLVAAVTLRQYRAGRGVCFILTPEELRCETPGGVLSVPWTRIVSTTYQPGPLGFAEHATYRVEYIGGTFTVDAWVEERERLIGEVEWRIGAD